MKNAADTVSYALAWFAAVMAAGLFALSVVPVGDTARGVLALIVAVAAGLVAAGAVRRRRARSSE